MKKALSAALVGALVLALAGWGAKRMYRELEPRKEPPVPVAKVKRGEVKFSVVAKGALQGGNSKSLTAPMTGSSQLVLTSLRKPGDEVKEGDVVAEFDTTEETYKLREAEADLAEAEQQVLQAKNEALARAEELNYELIKARADVQLAEIELERNPFVPGMVAKQNELALEATRERLRKLEHDYPERKNAAQASIAIQEASQKKAQMQAETAGRNIGMMTLKAPMNGYVNVERNTNSNFFFPGMQFPLLQVGDSVRPGMSVAQIPDMTSWEITAQISEEDRGHLETGQAAQVAVVALSGRGFKGKVTNLGGTAGPPWNRRFECKMSLDNPSPELRPGMSAQIVIQTHSIPDALWIPAQALFESDGRRFVYVRTEGGFVAKDVELVRRSESQVVLKGLGEGELVAMANPTEIGSKRDKGGATGAMKAIPK
ncbi:MAG: efflux RND transporter periplasmic adaptor subunit [Bryobacteraceae bacterium]